MFIPVFQANTAARRSCDETKLQQIRLVHVFDRVCIFVDCRRERFQARRAAAEFVDECHKKVSVRAVQAQLVNFQAFEGETGVGTRHRAAIGISEQSDSIVLVVSEETGHVSFTFNRRLYRNVSPQVLRTKLFRILMEQEEEDQGADAKKGGVADEVR